mmetsp:Transcript_14245/g.27109  ORF Transcript_14245/g.27109 Transcript_14245/m.27109 type:complete len:203 (-) Transcript_14245:186-794(-)|eukprot:CAMPEP_0170178226 /NCGR_PEP_ID=MMETSP0040_2-20121228/11748_1 /TAXON_ID=641309 /ORGANISM="Lotharella oceanica, Strain CCMP622" /LENGTH=202 /DNA_ID=CAMNT_0010421231 /DNA_START=234 /DNA_END=842 /DNA_ORIENTATION=-
MSGFLGQLPQQYPSASFVVATALGAFVGFPPISVLNLAAGVQFGVLLGTGLFLLGSTIGAVLALLLVQNLLRGVLLRNMTSWRPKWEAMDGAIKKEGPLIIVTLLRLSPAMPFSLCNLILGLTSVDLGSYTLGTAVGLVPFSLVYSYIGSVGKQAASGGMSLDDPLRIGITTAGLLATVGLTYKVGVIAQKALKGAQEDASK